jgi:hypothetical protein
LLLSLVLLLSICELLKAHDLDDILLLHLIAILLISSINFLSHLLLLLMLWQTSCILQIRYIILIFLIVNIFHSKLLTAYCFNKALFTKLNIWIKYLFLVFQQHFHRHSNIILYSTTIFVSFLQFSCQLFKYILWYGRSAEL